VSVYKKELNAVQKLCKVNKENFEKKESISLIIAKWS
jgi:hypothetical protein